MSATMNEKKFLLSDRQMPEAWYNVVADMPNKPAPLLDPQSHQPVTVDGLSHIFARAIAEQELSTEQFIEIPERVRDIYRLWR